MSRKPVRSQSKARAGKRHFRDKWARSAEKAAKKRKLRGIERKLARQNAPSLSQRTSRGVNRDERRGKHGRPTLGEKDIWWERPFW